MWNVALRQREIAVVAAVKFLLQAKEVTPTA